MTKLEKIKKAIEERQYNDPNQKGKEDLYIAKYLKTQGMQIKEAFDIWKTIAGEDRDTISTRFIGIWQSCDKVKLYDQTFAITKSDIDMINATDFRRWKKEFILLLLAYFKMTNDKWLDIYYFPPKAISRKVKRANRHENEGNTLAGIIPEMEKAGLIETKTQELLSWDGEKDIFEYIRMKYDKDDEVIFNFSDIDEVIEHFDLIKTERICTQCGSVFEIGPKTQRFLCPDCYKAKRQKDKNKYHH